MENKIIQKITIPEGLFGFEDYTCFQLESSEYEPFMWLRSEEMKTLSFLVIDPFLFKQDYEIDVDDESLKKIGIESPADVTVMVIVTLPSDKGPVTVNLQGPLIINKKTGVSKQVVLGDSRWSTKHAIISDTKK